MKIIVVENILEVLNKIPKNNIQKIDLICPICGSNQLKEYSEVYKKYSLNLKNLSYKLESEINSGKFWVSCENCEFEKFGCYLIEFLYILTKDNKIYCQKEIFNIITKKFKL